MYNNFMGFEDLNNTKNNIIKELPSSTNENSNSFYLENKLANSSIFKNIINKDESCFINPKVRQLLTEVINKELENKNDLEKTETIIKLIEEVKSLKKTAEKVLETLYSVSPDHKYLYMTGGIPRQSPKGIIHEYWKSVGERTTEILEKLNRLNT